MHGDLQTTLNRCARRPANDPQQPAGVRAADLQQCVLLPGGGAASTQALRGHGHGIQDAPLQRAKTGADVVPHGRLHHLRAPALAHVAPNHHNPLWKTAQLPRPGCAHSSAPKQAPFGVVLHGCLYRAAPAKP